MVAPTAERPYHTLITSGMSDLPMTTPAGADLPRYAELIISLPPEWRLTQEAFNDERNYWPIRLLKTLARLPHEHETWLGFGHTIPHNGDPAEPYAKNTELCSRLLSQPQLIPEPALGITVDDEKTIWFYSVVPLYRDEMEFKLKKGSDALFKLLEVHEVNEVLNIRAGVFARNGAGCSDVGVSCSAAEKAGDRRSPKGSAPLGALTPLCAPEYGTTAPRRNTRRCCPSDDWSSSVCVGLSGRPLNIADHATQVAVERNDVAETYVRKRMKQPGVPDNQSGEPDDNAGIQPASLARARSSAFRSNPSLVSR